VKEIRNSIILRAEITSYYEVDLLLQDLDRAIEVTIGEIKGYKVRV
jgi:hypothetical protein